MALLVGAAASLAANVAVGGHDLVDRALAGWPTDAAIVVRRSASMKNRRRSSITPAGQVRISLATGGD